MVRHPRNESARALRRLESREFVPVDRDLDRAGGVVPQRRPELVRRRAHVVGPDAFDEHDPRRHERRVGAGFLLRRLDVADRLVRKAQVDSSDAGAKRERRKDALVTSASSAGCPHRAASTSKRIVRMTPPLPTPLENATRQIERATLRNDGTTRFVHGVGALRRAR